MNRIVRVLAGTVVIALCVVAARVATSADANGGGGANVIPGLTLTTSDEKADMIGKGPRSESWAYWGRVRDPNQPVAKQPVGFYRAKCFWVLKAAWPDTTTQDLNGACDVVITVSGAAVGDGTLVAQGALVKPPGEPLFPGTPNRNLAVTGGTGKYAGRRGTIVLKDPKKLSLSFVQ